jgi:hypothetical protein
MKQVLEFIIKGLVEHPEAVRIKEESSGNAVQFQVEVAPGDLGRVIGKKGKTAKALRFVMSAAATRRRQHVAVKFLE